MHQGIIYLVISVITTCGYAVPLSQECGKPLNIAPDWRIINGKDAAVGEFPWFSMVSLLHTDLKHPFNNDFCGGSIINEKWVLTAAHCVFMNNEKLKVRLGVHNMSLHESSEVDFAVEKIIMHQKWDPSKILNDLALLKLNNSIDFKVKHKQLRPICLAKSTTKLTNKCNACGFGNVDPKSFKHPLNGILKKVDQTVSDPKECKKRETIFNTTTEICVISKEDNGTCQADSGGPLQCEGNDGRWYQIGIVSYGETPCGKTGGDSVYAKVSAYIDWIEKTITSH